MWIHEWCHISRDFTQFFMGVAQICPKLLSTIGMLMVPFLVNWLAPRNTVQEWRLVVLISCCPRRSRYYVMHAIQ
ncbi:Uncharacterized protein BM_BM8579 [Brugia malayi]|uniref:Uncharacterized protein n=1 Tax=Brugia malayi TaxID=6279 RepID=A0A4E9EV99_BRUMA|nr:Uncharacterized protein BM_BM8579 [Brugia malayi]VIO88025.1 Uncharacterized protein BM_BM8579 [Brugia malayi]